MLVGAKLKVMASVMVVTDSAIVMDGANTKLGCSVVENGLPDLRNVFSVLVGIYFHDAFCVVVGIYVHELCCVGSKENTRAASR